MAVERVNSSKPFLTIKRFLQGAADSALTGGPSACIDVPGLESITGREK